MTVEISVEGCRLIEATNGSTAQVYDTMHSLLMNRSRAYTSHFHNALRQQLEQLAQAPGTAEAIN